ncbi:hypothetical protein CMUS01_04875 [Colletotrichum musicola]|uniref:Uncharacterized protein n=1 Tax=Colletotrichum musicola TaxID=2175873 RepID=A0A8H6KV35_9PEZI|nr:hypothetical protein CMUS01_04875 [Colletotrichum musicola]
MSRLADGCRHSQENLQRASSIGRAGCGTPGQIWYPAGRPPPPPPSPPPSSHRFGLKAARPADGDGSRKKHHQSASARPESAAGFRLALRETRGPSQPHLFLPTALSCCCMSLGGHRQEYYGW